MEKCGGPSAPSSGSGSDGGGATSQPATSAKQPTPLSLAAIAGGGAAVAELRALQSELERVTSLANTLKVNRSTEFSTHAEARRSLEGE
jgi:hypothetical protein